MEIKNIMIPLLMHTLLDKLELRDLHITVIKNSDLNYFLCRVLCLHKFVN